MAPTRRQGSKGSRDGKRTREAKPRPPKANTPYGDIPIVKHVYHAPDGQAYPYYFYDLDFKPQLPPDAVRGEPRRQRFCDMCHYPRYYYLDQDKVCIQCNKSFVFSAKEQKFWYETLQFHFDSEAIRCPLCRKQRRTINALNNQVAATLASAKENPNDPDALIRVAEAYVRRFQRTGKGNLNHAISAARKARKLWAKADDSWFWEGLAQHLSGREDIAEKILSTLLSSLKGKTPKKRAMIREIKTLLSTSGK